MRPASAGVLVALLCLPARADIYEPIPSAAEMLQGYYSADAMTRNMAIARIEGTAQGFEAANFELLIDRSEGAFFCPALIDLNGPELFRTIAWYLDKPGADVFRTFHYDKVLLAALVARFPCKQH